jgi:hypothetical protein
MFWRFIASLYENEHAALTAGAQLVHAFDQMLLAVAVLKDQVGVSRIVTVPYGKQEVT